MIVIAFVLFAVLLVGWLAAPDGAKKAPAASTPAASLQLGEALA